MSEEALRREADKRAKEKVGVFVHAGVYVVVNAFLFVVWWSTAGPNGFPWFVFPLFGMGIGLTAHTLSVYTGQRLVAWMTARESSWMRPLG